MNSPTNSKINFTQIAGMLASAAAYFGLDLNAEQLVAVVLGIQASQSVLTAIFRTFYTGK